MGFDYVPAELGSLSMHAPCPLVAYAEVEPDLMRAACLRVSLGALPSSA